ncbi:hypothetical protein D3C87_1403150 [compost metagenome]
MAVSTRKPMVMYSAQSFGGWMPMMKMITIDSTESRANTVYQKRPMFHGPMVGHFEVP